MDGYRSRPSPWGPALPPQGACSPPLDPSSSSRSPVSSSAWDVITTAAGDLRTLAEDAVTEVDDERAAFMPQRGQRRSLHTSSSSHPVPSSASGPLRSSSALLLSRPQQLQGQGDGEPYVGGRGRRVLWCVSARWAKAVQAVLPPLSAVSLQISLFPPPEMVDSSFAHIPRGLSSCVAVFSLVLSGIALFQSPPRSFLALFVTSTFIFAAHTLAATWAIVSVSPVAAVSHSHPLAASLGAAIASIATVAIATTAWVRGASRGLLLLALVATALPLGLYVRSTAAGSEAAFRSGLAGVNERGSVSASFLETSMKDTPGCEIEFVSSPLQYLPARATNFFTGSQYCSEPPPPPSVPAASSTAAAGAASDDPPPVGHFARIDSEGWLRIAPSLCPGGSPVLPTVGARFRAPTEALKGTNRLQGSLQAGDITLAMQARLAVRVYRQLAQLLAARLAAFIASRFPDNNNSSSASHHVLAGEQKVEFALARFARALSDVYPHLVTPAHAALFSEHPARGGGAPEDAAGVAATVGLLRPLSPQAPLPLSSLQGLTGLSSAAETQLLEWLEAAAQAMAPSGPFQQGVGDDEDGARQGEGWIEITTNPPYLDAPGYSNIRGLRLPGGPLDPGKGLLSVTAPEDLVNSDSDTLSVDVVDGNVTLGRVSALSGRPINIKPHASQRGSQRSGQSGARAPWSSRSFSLFWAPAPASAPALVDATATPPAVATVGTGSRKVRAGEMQFHPAASPLRRLKEGLPRQGKTGNSTLSTTPLLLPWQGVTRPAAVFGTHGSGMVRGVGRVVASAFSPSAASPESVSEQGSTFGWVPWGWPSSPTVSTPSALAKVKPLAPTPPLAGLFPSSAAPVGSAAWTAAVSGGVADVRSEQGTVSVAAYAIHARDSVVFRPPSLDSLLKELPPVDIPPSPAHEGTLAGYPLPYWATEAAILAALVHAPLARYAYLTQAATAVAALPPTVDASAVSSVAAAAVTARFGAVPQGLVTALTVGTTVGTSVGTGTITEAESEEALRALELVGYQSGPAPVTAAIQAADAAALSSSSKSPHMGRIFRSRGAATKRKRNIARGVTAGDITGKPEEALAAAERARAGATSPDNAAASQDRSDPDPRPDAGDAVMLMFLGIPTPPFIAANSSSSFDVAAAAAAASASAEAESEAAAAVPEAAWLAAGSEALTYAAASKVWLPTVSPKGAGSSGIASVWSDERTIRVDLKALQAQSVSVRCRGPSSADGRRRKHRVSSLSRDTTAAAAGRVGLDQGEKIAEGSLESSGATENEAVLLFMPPTVTAPPLFQPQSQSQPQSQPARSQVTVGSDVWGKGGRSFLPTASARGCPAVVTSTFPHSLPGLEQGLGLAKGEGHGLARVRELAVCWAALHPQHADEEDTIAATNNNSSSSRERGETPAFLSALHDPHWRLWASPDAYRQARRAHSRNAGSDGGHGSDEDTKRLWRHPLLPPIPPLLWHRLPSPHPSAGARSGVGSSSWLFEEDLAPWAEAAARIRSENAAQNGRHDAAEKSPKETQTAGHEPDSASPQASQPPERQMRQPDVVVLFFDALGRAAFLRRMTHTAAFLTRLRSQSLAGDPSSGQSLSPHSVYEYFHYHVSEKNTIGNLTPFLSKATYPSAATLLTRSRGQYTRARTQWLPRVFRAAGYSTSSVVARCAALEAEAPWDAAGWDREVVAPFCHPEYDNGHAWGNGVGPYSIGRRCVAGRNVHSHAFAAVHQLLQLEDGARFSHTRASANASSCVVDVGTDAVVCRKTDRKKRPLFVFAEFSEAHEGTGEVIAGVDAELAAFLAHGLSNPLPQSSSVGSKAQQQVWEESLQADALRRRWRGFPGPGDFIAAGGPLSRDDPSPFASAAAAAVAEGTDPAVAAVSDSTNGRKVGWLRDAVVLIYSDHGSHMGPTYEYTAGGKLEHKFPLALALVPEWVEKQYPGVREGLAMNQGAFVTAYDWHATMKHLALLPFLAPVSTDSAPKSSKELLSSSSSSASMPTPAFAPASAQFKQKTTKTHPSQHPLDDAVALQVLVQRRLVSAAAAVSPGGAGAGASSGNVGTHSRTVTASTVIESVTAADLALAVDELFGDHPRTASAAAVSSLWSPGTISQFSAAAAAGELHSLQTWAQMEDEREAERRMPYALRQSPTFTDSGSNPRITTSGRTEGASRSPSHNAERRRSWWDVSASLWRAEPWGFSLLSGPIPAERTCQDAAVPAGWCACKRYGSVWDDRSKEYQGGYYGYE